MVLSDYHATKTATNHVLGLAYAAESGTERRDCQADSQEIDPASFGLAAGHCFAEVSCLFCSHQRLKLCKGVRSERFLSDSINENFHKRH